MICSKTDISHCTVQADDSSTSFTVPGTMEMLPGHGRHVVASFNNLPENRKYTTSVHIQYSGGVVQDTVPVDTSMCSYKLMSIIYYEIFLISGTFDVQNVTVDSVMNGRVCLTVDYVKGHETHCFVRLTSTQTGIEYNGTIEGTSGCIDVPPDESYDLIATDGDAVDDVNIAVPVRIPNILVPNYTAAPSITTYITPIATPPPGWSHHFSLLVLLFFASGIESTGVTQLLIAIIIPIILAVIGK